MHVTAERAPGGGPLQSGDRVTLHCKCGRNTVHTMVGTDEWWACVRCGQAIRTWNGLWRDSQTAKGGANHIEFGQPTPCFSFNSKGVIHPGTTGGTPMLSLPTYAAIAKSFGDSLKTMGEKSFTFEDAKYGNALAISFRSPSNGDSNMFFVLHESEWWVFDDHSESRVRGTYPQCAVIDVVIEAKDLDDLRNGKVVADDLFKAGKARITGDAQVISSLGSVFEKLFV